MNENDLKEVRRRFAAWIKMQKNPTLGKPSAYLGRVADQMAEVGDDTPADSDDLAKDAIAYLSDFSREGVPEGEFTVGYCSANRDDDRELVEDLIADKGKNYPLT